MKIDPLVKPGDLVRCLAHINPSIWSRMGPISSDDQPVDIIDQEDIVLVLAVTAIGKNWELFVLTPRNRIGWVENLNLTQAGQTPTPLRSWQDEQAH